MAITTVIAETVNAVAGSAATQFVTTGPFVLYGDYFKADEKAELQRLGPSGDYINATNQAGPIIVTECPNMVYVEAPGSYQLVKSATRTAAAVGYEEV